MILNYARLWMDLLSKQHHAYNKGRFVVTALYNLTFTTEKSLARKVFLATEGASNNVELDAISGAQIKLKVQDTLMNWISRLLCESTIY